MKKEMQNIIIELKLRRIISYHLQHDENSMDEEDFIWEDLNYISSLEDLKKWCNSFREYVWGDIYSFSNKVEHLSLEELAYYKNRILDIMGIEIFVIINDDLSIDNFFYKHIEDDIEKKREKMIDSFIKNNENRKSLFLMSENNISVDDSKINRQIILQLSKKICKEFSIRSLSFSNSIPDVDCFKYLLELAYSLPDFSLIIGDNNVGLHELSLSFEIFEENKGSYYDLNFKQISFTLDSYGSFSHEWFHFIDHKISQNIPFLKEECFFSNSIVPEHKIKLFKMKEKILNKFIWEDINDVRSIYASKNLLLSLPIMLNSLFYKYNKLDEFKKILNELDIVIMDSIKNNNEVDKFISWEKKIKYLLEEITLNDKSLIALKIEVFKNIEIIKNYSLNKYNKLRKPFWVFYSEVIDNENGINYYKLNSEMMARSFEIYVMLKISRKSWASFNHNYNFSYPKSEETEVENNWWNENIKELLRLAYL